MSLRLLAVGLCLAIAGAARAEPRAIELAATTSFVDSGLAADLLPKFKRATGIEVRLVSRGSTEDLYLAEKGLADVVIVNHPSAAARFAASGAVRAPREFMSNHFVLVGPPSDPAGARAAPDLASAFRLVAANKAPFISRADNSGTHEAERRLWDQAGVQHSPTRGYKQLGLGMAETVRAAARLQAYTLTDRATWLASPVRDRLAALSEGADLDNDYEVAVVAAEHHPAVKGAEAQAFVDWLTSPEGQGAIAAFEAGGEQAFVPTAVPTN
jgi:tungstate transport system substrate-binding protein